MTKSAAPYTKAITSALSAAVAIFSLILGSPFAAVIPARVSVPLAIIVLVVGAFLTYVLPNLDEDKAKTKAALEEFRHGQVIAAARDLSDVLASLKPALEAITSKTDLGPLTKVEPLIADGEKAIDVVESADHVAQEAKDAAEKAHDVATDGAAAAESVVDDAQVAVADAGHAVESVAAPVATEVPAAEPVLSAFEQGARDAEQFMTHLQALLAPKPV